MVAWIGAGAAVVIALPGTIGAVLGFLNRSSIREVHTQVNSNLAELKTQLAVQQAAVLQLTGELRQRIGFAEGQNERGKKE